MVKKYDIRDKDNKKFCEVHVDENGEKTVCTKNASLTIQEFLEKYHKAK